VSNPADSEANRALPKGVWQVLNGAERKRTYIFADGAVTIENVALICVSPNGTHYLETGSGTKHIVRCGWHKIDLDMDDWTHPGSSKAARQSFLNQASPTGGRPGGTIR
jgi:hypothetical protein